ncbi:MAG: tetratricopeptide repeat protein [Fimbriiglobus sp.]
MATDSGTSTRRTHYWQLPMFLVGIVAVGLAYAKFPPLPDTPAAKFSKNVKLLRQTLDKKNPADRSALENLAGLVSSDPAADPEAMLLAGSAYLTAAEQNPGELDRWKKAHEILANIEPAKLNQVDDRKRLLYRAAKAKAAMGQGTPEATILALADVPSGDEIDGERRRILAEAYLKTQPPELNKARDELQAYLKNAVTQNGETVAGYKLKLASIHMQLNDPEKARQCLRDIGAAAKPEVQALAKLQLGQLAASENNFSEAIKQFDAALTHPGLPVSERENVLAQTGLSLMRGQKLSEARRYFEEAAKGASPMSQTANLRVAECILRDTTTVKGQRSSAVSYLSKSMKNSSGESRVDGVPIDDLRAAFEEAIQVCVNDGDYSGAVQAATEYSPIAAPGRATEKRAEAYAAWAVSLQSQPAEAAKKYVNAANDYAALAATFPNPNGKAELLKRAAQCYRLGGDEKSATTLIDQLTQTAGLPEEVIAAAWVEKADSQLANNQFAEGVASLRQAMSKGTAVTTSARVKLAVAHIDYARMKSRTATTEEAKQEVSQFMQLGRDHLATAVKSPAETPTEKDAQQLAIFELGKMNLLQNDLSEAEARFRQLLQTYPNGTLSGSGKLYLGSCLLLLARGDHQGGRPPADAETRLSEARKLFETLSESNDPFLRTQSDIRLANTTLLLRKYDEMPGLCEKLSKRYQGKLEELIIQSMLYSAYHFADRIEPAGTVRARMVELYQKLPDTAFPGGAEEYTREYWQREWFSAIKMK